MALPSDPWSTDPNLGNTGRPIPTAFAWPRLLAWVLHLGLVAGAFRLSLAAWPGRTLGALAALAAVGCALGAVGLWMGNVHAWLDGARRRPALRGLLLATAAVNALLVLGVLPPLLRLVAGGTAGLWVRPGPFALFSLTRFIVALGLGLLALGSLVLHAWHSARLAWRLVRGVPAPPASLRLPEPLRAQEVRPEPPARLAGTLPESPPASRWHDARPPALHPATTLDGSTGLAAYRFIPLRAYGDTPQARSEPLARIRQARERLDWPALEWVLRTRPGWEEERDALLALPNLAAVVDAPDAADIRAWLVRYTGDPRTFEVQASHREDDHPAARIQVVQMSGYGRDALQLWDEERACPTSA